MVIVSKIGDQDVTNCIDCCAMTSTPATFEDVYALSCNACGGGIVWQEEDGPNGVCVKTDDSDIPGCGKLVMRVSLSKLLFICKKKQYDYIFLAALPTIKHNRFTTFEDNRLYQTKGFQWKTL